MAERFAGKACGSTLDLFVGYDERELHEDSRDLTTFQTPFGAMRLTTLPMGWSNSVPVFHDDVTFILQPEIPETTIPYIDDVPVIGPVSDYKDANGRCETIPENPGIRRFIWEHMQDVNRVVQRVKHAGGTFSGKKFVCCAREFTAVGHRCTPEGRVPEPGCLDAVLNWGPCSSLTEVRSFLGTVGVARIFVKNFGKLAAPLTRLQRKAVPFEWGEEQQKAMDALKEALVESPALRAIDYESDAPVILAVDTSHIAVGYQLCQEDPDNPKKRYYNRFGSITLNEREGRFSQPKLELYGLYRSLRALRFWLVGVRNLVVEMDATSTKGMIENPDVAPSAVMNRWIIAIKMFHFSIRHVPGVLHGPDGLSRRPAQPGDPPISEHDEEFDDWIDNLYNFVQHSLPPRTTSAPTGAILINQSMGRTRKLPSVEPPCYELIPRTPSANLFDDRLATVYEWLASSNRPAMTPEEFDKFARYARQFFLKEGDLWKVSDDGKHRRVLPEQVRPQTLVEMHDYVGHHGIQATIAFIAERFWWPEMKADIAWYVRTCHQCQIRQTTKVLIPPTTNFPAAPFVRVHVDTMDMPGTYKYLLHGRCATTSYPEARAVTSQTADVIADWIYQELLCRWGAIAELVSDNGGPWVKAIEQLAKKFHVYHIKISGYNSRANGIIEQAHYTLREALIKASDGDEKQWVSRLPSVLWADRVTVRKRMGCSPYFAVTGTNAIMPLDIVEATYLCPIPTSLLSTADLIAMRARAIQHRPEDIARIRSNVFRKRVLAAQAFEDAHAKTIQDFNFKKGALVLLRNTKIEKSLNRKMKPRYLGPLLVITRNRGGAYRLAELDGTPFDRPTAAFRVIPYLARKRPIHIDVKDLGISNRTLQQMQNDTDPGEDELVTPEFAEENL